MVPVIDTETAVLAANMPLAFIQDAGSYILVALLSLEPSRNPFLAPNNQWIDRYVPLCLRVHPFRMVYSAGSDKAVLCIDEDSGLIGEAGAGEPFFDADGDPSEAISAVVRLTAFLEQHRRTTNLATAALADAGVLVPWDLKVGPAGAQKAVTGLYSADETAINGLDPGKFLQLRTANALAVAYAQMVSQVHVLRLLMLSPGPHQHSGDATTAETLAGLESLDSIFEMSNDEVVRFR